MSSKSVFGLKLGFFPCIVASLVAFAACSDAERPKEEGAVSTAEQAAKADPPAQVLPDNSCMDDRSPLDLHCASNDVKIAQAVSVSQPTCIDGTTIHFDATFRLVLNATTRYDIGMYLSGDGDPNGDGALTGQCNVGLIPQSFNIDPAPDTCGDMNVPERFVTITGLEAPCVDTDGDGFVNLPNCTSWRQPGQNEVCTSVLDATPGSAPKCNCDKNFNIPIEVRQPSIAVVKTASPTAIDEPGGTFNYTVQVTNTGNVSVTLSNIVDTFDNSPPNPAPTTYQASAICGATSLAPGASTTCTFSVALSGNPRSIRNVACVNGNDSRGVAVSGCDDETVTIRNRAPSATLAKDALSIVSAIVRYHVRVDNTSSASDPLTLSALNDDQFGSLTSIHDRVVAKTCVVPQTIAPGGFYECTFDARVDASSLPHTNTASATASDDDGSAVSPNPSDSATVSSFCLP